MDITFETYLFVIAAILAICAIASFLTPRYMRACPGCCEPLATTASHCRSCGYRPT